MERAWWSILSCSRYNEARRRRCYLGGVPEVVTVFSVDGADEVRDMGVALGAFVVVGVPDDLLAMICIFLANAACRDRMLLTTVMMLISDTAARCVGWMTHA